MRNEEVVRQPELAGIALTPAEKRRIVWHVIGTVLGALFFAAVLMVPDVIQFRVRMPGHVVLFWFPALMVGRALSGYRGSSIIVSTGGGMLANALHPSVDSSIVGFVLAAFAVEGIMLLIRQNPTAMLGILIGMAASIGKMIPKVAVVLTAGATPHHNWTTLPFMLESYLLFGALAGVIYVGGLLLGRKAQSRISSAKSQDK
jgi:hypothetical protein